jgi:hypothetical protein
MVLKFGKEAFGCTPVGLFGAGLIPENNDTIYKAHFGGK